VSLNQTEFNLRDPKKKRSLLSEVFFLFRVEVVRDDVVCVIICGMLFLSVTDLRHHEVSIVGIAWRNPERYIV
jgi:hypothetical protein